MIILLLLVRATYIWVLFFAHIPFVVNRTFNITPTERLQQYLEAHMILEKNSSTCLLCLSASVRLGCYELK